MKKRISILALLLALMVTLVACGGGGTPVEEDTGADDAEVAETETDEDVSDFKIGMVTDEGGVNDQSFNQSAWEGLVRVNEELGFETDYQESEQESDFAPNFETLLDNDFDMMWGVGFKLAGATYEAAQNNPDKYYGIIDFSYEDNEDFPEGTPENVIGVRFHDEQSSFLAGYLAAHKTETDVVGFVGGIESNIISAFEYGYKAGVQYGAKELGKEIKVLSQYADSFSDAAQGKAIATNFFNQGADIVFHAAGGVGDGVIEAAKEQDLFAIGVDRDQNDLAPDNVITSVMKRVDQAVFNVAEDIKNGDFEGGRTVVYGLEDGGVGLAPTTDKNVSKEILDKIPAVEKLIIDKEIVVPVNADEYEDFLTDHIN